VVDDRLAHSLLSAAESAGTNLALLGELGGLDKRTLGNTNRTRGNERAGNVKRLHGS
jgi:hypothetical protein